MQLTQHPLSAAYPPMSDEEFQSLIDSVSTIGVQIPITLYDEQVLDGWHRYRAAQAANVECPKQALPDDVDPRDFARSQGARRNITASQNALAIAAIYAWQPTGRPQKGAGPAPFPKGKTNDELAGIAHVSKRTMQQAKEVHTKGSQKVVEAVKAGSIGLEKASAIAKLPRDQQDEAIAKPVPKPAKPEKPAKPVKEYAADSGEDLPGEDPSAVQILSDENDRLTDRLAVAAMDATPEEKQLAAELIADLRSQLKSANAELEAVRSSRDSFMREVSELKKQCVKNKRQIEKLQKQADASQPVEAF